jgi:hypothetical protein
MVSAVFGVILSALGLWGVFRWSAELVQFLKGMFPISLVFAGVIAIVAGISSFSTKTPPGAKKKL